jgi:putative flippase GtrA
MSRLCEKWSKLLKFAVVSIVSLIVTQSALWSGIEIARWSPLWANFWAVSIASLPAYYLNRRWVWNLTDSHSIRIEVLPFWAFNLVGLFLSTGAVVIVSQVAESTFLILLANFGSFGLLWVGKFVFLNNFLFRRGI